MGCATRSDGGSFMVQKRVASTGIAPDQAVSASLDGQPVQNLSLPPENSPYRATSPGFIFHGDPSLQVGDPCLPRAWAGVADGYWVMLKPLSRGAHTLVFSGTETWPPPGSPFTVTVTYNLTIN